MVKNAFSARFWFKNASLELSDTQKALKIVEKVVFWSLLNKKVIKKHVFPHIVFFGLSAENDFFLSKK